MGDCEHKWLLTVDKSGCEVCRFATVAGVAACIHCDESIGPTEIERRLNEHDGLRKLLNINAYDDKTIDEWLREQE